MTDRHDESAKKLVDDWEECSSIPDGYMSNNEALVNMISAALRAEASKRVVGIEAIELAAKKDIGLHRQDNRPKTCTNNDFYIAVTSAFIRGAKYVSENLTLSPREACGCELVLPERRTEPTEQTSENVDEFRFVRTWNRVLDEVRKLNPSLKVRDKK